jgi:hypothetical protein
MQVEPPPSFSEFIKQSNGGLASSEAMSTMLEQMQRRQAGQEPGSNASWEVGGGEAVEGGGQSGANEEWDQDLNQLASQDMTQSAAGAVQGADEHVGLEAGRTRQEKGGCLSNEEDGKAASSHPGTSPRPLGKQGKWSVDLGKLPGLHAMAAKEDDAAHLTEGIPKQEPGSSLGGQQPKLEEFSSEAVKPWGEAVEEARPKEGLDQTREEIVTFINLSGESSSGPGSVTEASGGSLQTETSARLEQVVDAKEGDSPLPPLESQVIESNGQPQIESSKVATSRKRAGKKNLGVEAKGEEVQVQVPKARKKRAPAKKKAEA